MGGEGKGGLESNLLEMNCKISVYYMLSGGLFQPPLPLIVDLAGSSMTSIFVII